MHLLHLFTLAWTNLLTRCPVPVSYFLLFSVSENLHSKYSRNCTGQKPRQYFPVTYTETEGETEGGRGAPTPPGSVGPTPVAQGGGVGPTGLPRGQPFAHIYLFIRKP